jgi:hypothetical protein
MRPRVITVALSALVAAGLLAGCAAPRVIESLWPTASAERSVPRPAGTLRWPLTGLPAPSSDAVVTRVVAVKIENSPAARPQTGLEQADIVYEMISEGGITRFQALFQSQVPKAVGPVRSCRPPDIYLVPQYHSIFAHVGGPKSVRNILAADHTRYNDMDQFFNPASYYRVKTRPAPHNMYLDIAKLRTFASSKRGYPATETITGLEFSPSAAAATTPSITQINVPVSSSNKVQWNFDAVSRTYLRSINGKPHKDAVSGRQLRAVNVVVLWVQINPYPGDIHGVVEITLAGTGRASVFSGGRRTDGTWQAGTTAPPVLKDTNGETIKLDPGNTWFQVIANDQNITMK